MIPTESGIALIGVGTVAVMLYRPAGALLVLTGALSFAPRLFRRIECCVRRRCPRVYREGRRQIDRFIDDLEKRYPPASH